MKWKILLVIFFVSLMGILIGNLSVVNKIDLNPIHFFQTSPFFNRKVTIVSDIKNIPPSSLSPTSSSSGSPKNSPKSVSIQEKNPQLLNQYLNDLNFFGKSKVQLRESQTWVTISKLNIHLTNKEYFYNNIINSKNESLRSTKEIFSNGILDLYVGMNPSYYFSENYDPKKAEKAFENQILFAIFALTKPDEYVSTNDLLAISQSEEFKKILNLSVKNPIFEFKTN